MYGQWQLCCVFWYVYRIKVLIGRLNEAYCNAEREYGILVRHFDYKKTESRLLILKKVLQLLNNLILFDSHVNHKGIEKNCFVIITFKVQRTSDE